jgi:hypothetical protein
LKDLGPLAQHRQPDYLVREQIHLERSRTAVGAFPALETFSSIERTE